MKRRYCLTLDLKNDPRLIAEYTKHHEKMWPEITKSIHDAGIEDMEIYRLGTRLFMIIEAGGTFSFQAKAVARHTGSGHLLASDYKRWAGWFAPGS